jgi:hypothetical protein
MFRRFIVVVSAVMLLSGSFSLIGLTWEWSLSYNKSREECNHRFDSEKHPRMAKFAEESCMEKTHYRDSFIGLHDIREIYSGSLAVCVSSFLFILLLLLVHWIVRGNIGLRRKHLQDDKVDSEDQ